MRQPIPIQIVHVNKATVRKAHSKPDRLENRQGHGEATHKQQNDPVNASGFGPGVRAGRFKRACDEKKETASSPTGVKADVPRKTTFTHSRTKQNIFK